MRRLLVPVLATALVLAACSDDDTPAADPSATQPSAGGDVTLPSGSETPDTVGPDTTDPASTDAGVPSGSLDLAAVATAAQAAIDEGDSLGKCPFDPAAVAAAVATVAALVPEFGGPVEDDGQVYYGGAVDITYCQIRPDEGAISSSPGIVDMRLDVHPGTADSTAYFDEEWGDAPDDLVASDAAGGTLSTGCFDALRCIAMWQGDGLFVALVLEATDAASASMAGDALMAALPLVAAGLLSGR